MSHVILYICEATFDGSPEHDYAAPEKGQTVDCLLLLRQDAKVEDLKGAEAALKKYGLGKCEDMTGHPVYESMLRTGAIKGMDYQYHEALNVGVSLVWHTID
ncbi:MAG: hypothetical protein KJO55_01920 [Gammaproteobacteria bacterium]|nr:hypothetical protein [Gammaproteobacteria bacterium]